MTINRKQARGIRAGFAEWAESYDLETRGWMRWAAPAKLADWLRPCLRDGMATLDLGCGTGQGPRFYQPLRLRWTGVDLSAPMLEIARGRAVYETLVRMNVERRRWPFESGAFDAALSCGIFEFTEKLDHALGELHRILAPDAMLAFTVEAPEDPDGDFEIFDSSNYHYKRFRYGAGRVAGLLDAAGFDLLRSGAFQAYRDDQDQSVPYSRFLARRRSVP